MVLREDRQGAAEHGHRITAAIACHVARAGGTADQLTQLLLHSDHEGGRHARHIALRSGQARALDYIRRVWASASAVVTSTRVLESRQHAYEVLAALRDRIETTPWRGERGRTALRVLRAHLNFAEIAGGPLHHASERQTAEEAGVSRTTLRAVYETVLKPQGWLRRLRVGHGREGSTWYLADGNAPASLSRFRTTQYPPDSSLEEWPTPETGSAADIDSTVVGRLMGHDAFAHHGLGSSALMIIGALHARPAQTVGELVGSASVSRATAYRTLRRLADHGLVHHSGETWSLAPRALEGFGTSLPDAVPGPTAYPAQGWDAVARQCATAGVAARRKALHAVERAAYRDVLERLSEHRRKAMVIVRDGRQVLIPAPRPDEIPSAWHAPGGRVLDPVTGRPDAEWRVATDGRLILITPSDQRSYDELAAAHAEALSEWESAA
ncbi:transcriptional regulator [Streptomyces sp. MNU76]|uniref:helix-turn-helix domain-containing protein n=1 Tax=Streptomyces sp. MNU76 TaxID=2560026 RepID=UPI001E5D8A25|nr:helix-turn-helix domain-containing protein [Streptomyces sp. MNU76]MCC9705527.1 transcriptional regulator [Streptomyces sp. MNU76]